MNPFIDYFPPTVDLEVDLEIACSDMAISSGRFDEVRTFLGLLKLKDTATYEHSIRVGLVSRAIARCMHLDQKPAFYAGLLHDCGKAQTNPATLKKTSGWTPADTAEIMSHVVDGYRLLRGQFDFTAEIILWHHRFQPNSYPALMPPPIHDYGAGTRVMIPMFGRILAIADQYDACHRVNERTPADRTKIGETIKEQMIAGNPDQRVLIEELNALDVLTTRVYVG